MSTEGTGVAAGPVILIALSIAALLLGASVMPSLGDQSPGASVTSPEVGDGEELDPVGPDSADGQGEELDIDGAGGDAGTVEPPEALLALGELLSPFALSMDIQGQGGGLELPEMAGDGSDDESLSQDSDEADGDDETAESSEDSDDGSSDGDSTEDESTNDDSSEDESTDDSDDENELDEEESDEGLLDTLTSIGPYALGVIGLLALGMYLWQTDRGVITALRQLPRRMLSAAIAVLIALANQLERGIAALKRLESVVALPTLVFGAIAGWFASAQQRVQAVSLGSLRGGSTADDTATADGRASEEPESAKAQIHEAWETLLVAAPVARYRTAAPGEVARNAVGAGLPTSPVQTITEAFRDVEYGDIDPEVHVEQTQQARMDLETSLQEDEQSGEEE